MEVNFKYEIGQFVFLRSELTWWHQTYASQTVAAKERGYESMGDMAVKERKPRGMQVIERHMQQCYGGVQLHYHVRAGAQIIPFSEPEITTDFSDVA